MASHAAPYEHTQVGQIHFILYLISGVLVVGSIGAMAQPPAGILMLVLAGAFIFLASCFRTLTVRDEDSHMRVAFGPISLFSRQIFYQEITEVRKARSALIDGFGIHWIPGRGWTWNLWTFECVELHLGNRVLRIGTDDSDNLVAFLHRKIKGGLRRSG